MNGKSMGKEILATVARQRGDARLQIRGLDLGEPGRRLVLSIQRPRDVEDEIDGQDNWYEQARFALRAVELDDLIAKLQNSRAFLT